MKKKNRKIRLSQCMIVKNEEKNIRRALSWGREIVCEQIVVDTGSTDRTVEIAEEMGAKVYHFAWCDDFSAAKNYAIEQASGDWIAFLDADEYFDEKNTSKLLPVIAAAEDMSRPGKVIHAIRTGRANLDEKGAAGVIDQQDRVFRNMKNLRYANRIHEALHVSGGGTYECLYAGDELIILHTGYTAEAYEETRKLERNISMLEKELEENPHNAATLAYLGDSYMTMKQFDKAKEYFHKAVSYGMEQVDKRVGIEVHVLRSIIMLLALYNREPDPAQEETVRELHRQYAEVDSAYPDGDCYFGLWLYQNRQYEECRRYLESSLAKMREYKGNIPLYMNVNLKLIYVQLADCCRQMGDDQETVRNCILSLGVDKYYTEPLVMLLGLLKAEAGEAASAGGTWGLMSKLYNLTALKDQMAVLKGAKLTEFKALEERVYNAMPPQQRRAVQEALEKKRGDEGT
ncbi:MAG TPA: glycosyltransferase [Candidatus Mediterraneibacter merdavium]|nr:glycosyltransferase [Candidatus Mediterraneibacter merdavium]